MAINYDDIINTRGLLHDPYLVNHRKVGDIYRVDPLRGDGYTWLFRCRNGAYISVTEQILFDDTVGEFNQMDVLCIRSYHTVSGKLILPHRDLYSGDVQIYTGASGSCKFVHYRKTPVRFVNVALTPESYGEVLRDRFNETYEIPKEALQYLDDLIQFPELASVMSEIREYRGSGTEAENYYNEKADEIITLVMRKAEEMQELPHHDFSPGEEDRETMFELKHYIDHHLDSRLSIDDLSAIAHMSPAKLKASFKESYDTSIHQYIMDRRIETAGELLRESDLPVGAIGWLVGYNSSVRFSDAFKEKTGVRPAVYRRKNQ